MKSKYFNNLTAKEILSETIVYDNGGESYDRYTIFTPDGSVFGMNEDARGFNQFLGDHSEFEEGSHLGKKLKGVPKGIKNAVLNRMIEDEANYGHGGSIPEGNYRMMLSQAKEVQHHIEELQNILMKEDDIEAWVVAKMENVSSTLSDITHYLDGKTEYGDGGVIENIKGEYQIAGNDGGGVWTYSKRTADEIASKYKGSVQEDGSKWYVSLSRFSDGGEVDDDDLIEDDDNEYANGGSLEDIRKKYEVNRMMIRSKVALAIGIDDAMRYLDEDFVVSPYSLLEGAVNKGFIDAQEIDKNLWESALSEAYRIDDIYRDSGQGIGGSDMNAFISSMLNDAGIKIEVVNNRYERVGGKFAKGGGVDMLKEDDFVWNAVGKKLIVNKVTKDEYYLVGFGQISASPFSKNKVHSYLKKGEWSLKAPKFAKGGEVEQKFILSFNYNPSNLSNKEAEKIVSKYTKNWKHDNDFDEVSFFVMDLKKSQADELKQDLKMEDVYNIEIQKSRYAKGGEVESTIDILMTEEPKVWDKFDFNSGGEIRASKEKTKKYAEELEKVFSKKGIKRGSLSEKIYEELQDENFHLLNEFLTRNGYFKKATNDKLIKTYENPIYVGAYADKDSITIQDKANSNPKPSTKKKIQRKKLSARTKYIPNRDIKEIELKSGEEIAGSKIVDGVYKKK